MVSPRKAAFLAVLGIVSCALPVPERETASPLAVEAGTLLAKDIYRKLNRAVFEVVVPKQEDAATRYERPLPFHKLPFRQRNDKFHGIGTAFCLRAEGGTQRVVSAAHVFGVTHESLRTDFQLRDTEGRLYRIKQVTRFSNYRDLIALDLETFPAEGTCLDAAQHVEIGDIVFNVGNAQGEGISYRGGQVASFTPEEINGSWKFLRFSAPASPGNSGGPLLNVKGDVVGVVTRKNQAENLNFAVPIDEVRKLSATEAEFFTKRVSLTEGTRIVDGDWSFSQKLPATLGALGPPARASLRAFYDHLLERLEKEDADKIFPGNPRFREYLTRQTFAVRTIGHVKSSAGDTNWFVEVPQLKRVEIGPDQEVRYHFGHEGPHDILAHRPRDLSLRAYWESPARVMEDVLKSTSIDRTMAGERIRILSYGPPKLTARWKDRLGRPWLSSGWQLTAFDEYVGLECLLVPSGVACLWISLPMHRWGTGQLDRIRSDIEQTIVPYSGTLGEWKEFLAMDKSERPDFLHDVALDFTAEKKLAFRVGEFSLDAPVAELTADTQLSVEIGYSPTARLAAIPLGVEIRPQETRRAHFGVHVSFAPLAESSKPHQERWKAILDRRAPYDGSAVLRNEARQVNLVLDAKRGITPSRPAGSARYLAYCGDNAAEEVVLKARCQRFAAGVTIAP